jgi:arabinofuranan 3-O-arabinosyltransferase
VTRSFFTTLGVEPIRGRIFASEEDSAGADPVAVLSSELWQRAFGGREDIVGSSVEIEITGVSVGEPPLAAALAGVGFAEIDLGLGATTEWIRPPIDALDAYARTDTPPPLALVFTRLRVDPTDPWRSDPEPHLLRRLRLREDHSMDATATLRLDRRASDADLAALLSPATTGTPPIASSRITGGAEQRGAAAVDGDPATAWMTPFDEAVGSSLRFDDLGPLDDALVLDQPTTRSSTITGIRVERFGAGAADAVVPEPDGNGRSTIALPPAVSAPAGPLTITITTIEPSITIDRRYGDPRTLPAAISELTSTDGIDVVRLDRDAPIEASCSVDNPAVGDGFGSILSIDGDDVDLSFSTTAGSLLDGEPVIARACEPVVLPSGSHDLTGSPTRAPGLVVDQVVLADAGLPAAPTVDSLVDVDVVRNDPRARDIVVSPCPTGCWLVFGEGFNTAWEATLDGEALGEPVPVDGGFNGWQLPPSAQPRAMTFRWSAQTPVTVGLSVSALAALLCVAIAVAGSRSSFDRAPLPRMSRRTSTASRRRVLASGIVLVTASALLISPIWGMLSLVPAGALVALSTRSGGSGRVLELSGVLAAGVVAGWVLLIVRRDRPFPDAGWTLAFDHLNGVALYAAVAIAVGAMFAPDAAAEQD